MFPRRGNILFWHYCLQLHFVYKKRLFIKRRMSDTSSENEWRRVAQRVTKNDNQWLGVVQRVTRRDNKWQRVVSSDTTSQSDWEQVKKVALDFKTKQRTTWFLEVFLSFLIVRVSEKKYKQIATKPRKRHKH